VAVVVDVDADRVAAVEVQDTLVLRTGQGGVELRQRAAGRDARRAVGVDDRTDARGESDRAVRGGDGQVHRARGGVGVGDGDGVAARERELRVLVHGDGGRLRQRRRVVHGIDGEVDDV